MPAPLNPRDAKACMTCHHWAGQPGDIKAECRNPKLRHGVTYEDPDGKEKHVEHWVSGPYATCNHYEAKPLWCAFCGKMGDHQSGWCPELKKV